MDLLDMDEAALLAELKAISSSSRRMEESDDEAVREEIQPSNSTSSGSPSKSSQIQLSIVQRHSPAAMRRRKHQDCGIGMAPSDEVDSHLSATPSCSFGTENTPQPPPPLEESSPQKRRLPVSPVKQLPPLKKTDHDEVVASSSTMTIAALSSMEVRGGPAEDPELLALLKNVSNQSASASRFQQSDAEETTRIAVASCEKPSNDALPPWKRRGTKKAVEEVAVLVAEPPTMASSHPESELAVDEAELHAVWNSVSTQSSSSSSKDTIVAATEPLGSTLEHPISVVTSEDEDGSDVHGRIAPTGIPSAPSTFSGERGGAAQDEELLAFLRGVSNQSSSASRFQSHEAEAAPSHLETNDTAVATKVPPRLETNAALPPWKRRGVVNRTKKEEVEIIVAEPSASVTTQDATAINAPPPMGIPSQPSTFQGERGGAAEDAELLELLRGVSNQSSSASRFGMNEEESVPVVVETDNTVLVVTSQKIASSSVVQLEETTAAVSLPPWKRRAAVMNRSKKATNDVTVVVSSAVSETPIIDDAPVMAPPMGIPSTSTYQGERGGAAEDAELLALLRGVSSSAQRFNDDDDENPAQPSSVPPITATGTSAFTPANISSEDAALQVLPADEVPKSLSDKNWKVRCQAYDTLSLILCDHVKNGGQEIIDSDTVMNGLDERVASFVEDSNAGALDKALEFCILYAEHCRGAGQADQARAIVSSLIRKNGFSSRPSTLKLSNTLALNLMEVGSDGAASVHAVVDVLLAEGLSSKKPKVIQASVSLIVEAMYHFGAASLPLAAITQAAPKMLSHSNAAVRDGCIQILAEICRTLGSKAPILNVLEIMKKAQLMELDNQLTEQPEPTPIRTGLRSSRQTGGSNTPSTTPGDALAALQAGSKELEAQRYAARAPVDVVAAMARTDYANQIVLSKWSEKVAALDKVLECGGEKPYKLVPPSSTVNYGPLISDMKKLLGHTHFAVCGRAIQVLSMLAQGVGEKLYPHLRPILTPLLQLSKDKKLTNDVSNGLDVLFGNVLSFDSLLEDEDAIPSMVNEKIQKNALARATALNFLQRCVKRRGEAGPKGSLSPPTATKIATLSIAKLDDSDASVRKAAMGVFEALLQVDDAPVVANAQKLLDQLRTSNPRAYKVLSSAEPEPVEAAKPHVPPPPVATNIPVRSRSAAPSKRPPSPAARATAAAEFPAVDRSMSTDDRTMPHLEEALIHITGLSIPQWDAAEDEGGILSGLKAPKWQLRHDAIELLRSFIDSGELEKAAKDSEKSISCILFIVREQTRGFRETNVNIMKAILHLCISVCEYFESKELPLPDWAMRDIASVGVQKISDRKLIASCQKLLSAAASVSVPATYLRTAFEELKSVKSPVAHEEFLRWFQTFCTDFGAICIGRGISELIPYFIEELGSVNAKVKKEVMACFALLHRQVGPGLKSLAVSLAKQSSIKEQLQKCFEDNPFDPSFASTTWARASVVGRAKTLGGNGESATSLVLDVPTVDLFALLPVDILSKLGSKEGKTAWKMRKEALDEIETSLKGCNGLLDTSPTQMKQLAELTRGLRDRLTDLQINLRPSAARLVGVLLSSVDRSSQAKLGKLVLPALVNEAMNDIKKPMRDASLEAIRTSITASQLEGGGLNVSSLEALVVALVSEVNEAAIRAGGLPDVLMLMLSIVDSLPKLDNVSTTRGTPIGEKYAAILIECLTSSKSETRSAAVSLLDASVEKEIVSLESIKKATDRLKPALQRSVGPIIAKMAKKTPVATGNAMNGSTSLSVNGVPKVTRSTDGKQGPYSNSSLTRVAEPKASEVLTSSPSNSSFKQPRHPLVSETSKQNVNASRTIIWTEYPEEPHGSLLENLKRVWLPFLPAATASAIFPSSGLRKQDDAKAGIDALERALTIDRLEGSSHFVDQLSFIMKWTMFVLCSKESTVGLQDILALLKDVLAYLIEIRRELNDSETMETVPFLIDKLSGAKGRFRDSYMEIYALLENEVLISPKRLEICCVAVIESSPHARAKAQACQTCIECIQKTGLAGLGKKGILATAKMLSHDTTMHRIAALDLLESILSKMNGDVTRLVRICGPNLSDKARQLLEERWYKNQARETSISQGSTGSPGHRLNPGSPQKAIRTNIYREDRQLGIFDELPRLTLRETGKESAKASPRKKIVEDIPSEPFVFTFSVAKSTTHVHADQEIAETSSGKHSSYINLPEIEPSGAAAALRARLLKIREKGKANDDGPSAVNLDSGFRNPDVAVQKCIDFDAAMDSIRILLKQPSPLSENDSYVEGCIDSLKVVHASLSEDLYATVDFSDVQLSDIRRHLTRNVDEAIGLLRCLIGFAINSGDEESSPGMLLSLLQLCLATLMALFRDDEISMLVSAAELGLLIRETGTALLDARLSASDELNNGARSQMIRAINKLAVQAATASARHTAFQALLDLQQQLKSTDISGDENFRSRLSRVVVKLFGRVVKAEESASAPYTPGRIDMEALLCTLEDSLVASKYLEELNADESDVCVEMVESLIRSMTEVQGGDKMIRRQMEDLDIDPNTSALGVLLTKCSVTQYSDDLLHEIDTNKESGSAGASSQEASQNVQPKTPSKDVATLVSRLGLAPPGEEREAALEAIRAYKFAYGREELDAHLQQLSGAFREFIVEQIDREPSPQKQSLPVENAGSSVSERIRSLRSRLQSSEAANGQKVISNDALGSSAGIPETTAVTTEPATASTSTVSSILTPSPSKIPTLSSIKPTTPLTESKLPVPGQSRLLATTTSSNLSSAQSLRERLAARQAMMQLQTDNRSDVNTTHSNPVPESSLSGTSKLSLGRAAALRARLEVVKQQSKKNLEG